jgi:hypothetical protein
MTIFDYLVSSPDFATLSKRIRETRQTSTLRPNQLAKLSGVPLSTLAHIYANTGVVHDLGLFRIKRLAQALEAHTESAPMPVESVALSAGSEDYQRGYYNGYNTAKRASRKSV